jgi:hypothetical protein
VEPRSAGRPRLRASLPGLAWSFAVVRAAFAAWELRLIVMQPGAGWNLDTVGALQWVLVPVVFTVLGAFVVSRRPDNLIGWLLLTPGVAITLPGGVAELTQAPADPGVLVLLELWYVNVSWVLLIFPVMLMVALFPTGRPVNPRWRWHTWLVLGMGASFLLLVAVFDELGVPDGEVGWTVANPIGLVPSPETQGSDWFTPIWAAGLLAITLGAVGSMVVRFRRAAWVERQQLKWLLYAVAVFGTTYSAAAIVGGWAQGTVLGLLFGLSVMFVPVSMTIAILRHRVFDIDVIIRRTVIYTVVTVLLAGVFVGSVVLFQGLTQRVTGTDSSVGVAASTLLIAALFNPLRVRIQSFVGRRFSRGSYQLERTLSDFAGRARTETSVDRLWSELLGVVDDALHPGSIALLLVRDGRLATTASTAAAASGDGDRPA